MVGGGGAGGGVILGTVTNGVGGKLVSFFLFGLGLFWVRSEKKLGSKFWWGGGILGKVRKKGKFGRGGETSGRGESMWWGVEITSCTVSLSTQEQTVLLM